LGEVANTTIARITAISIDTDQRNTGPIMTLLRAETIASISLQASASGIVGRGTAEEVFQVRL
jgi:hypothetical protein